MNSIEKEGLYQAILKEPISQGAEQLCVLSGYVKPSFLERYLDSVEKKHEKIHFRVIQGMAKSQGITRQDHEEFVKLDRRSNVEFFYFIGDIHRKQSVHAKLYIWIKDNQPYRAYIGSANFTGQGFSNDGDRIEMMTGTDPDQAYKMFDEMLKLSQSISNTDITKYIKTVSKDHDPSIIENNSFVKISLLNRFKEVNKRSGLNLGFAGRNTEASRDIAAIPIGKENRSFFPGPKIPFNVQTDDGKKFVMKSDKHQSTLTLVENLKCLGEYFRDRLNIQHGTLVTAEHLDIYGTTDLVFEKDESGIFYMNFSSPIYPFDRIWSVLFNRAESGLEVATITGVPYKLNTSGNDIVIINNDVPPKHRGEYSKEQAKNLWESEILFVGKSRRDPMSVATTEIGGILNYKGRHNNSYWWIIYSELYKIFNELS